jgi:hypothetical protein
MDFLLPSKVMGFSSLTSRGCSEGPRADSASATGREGSGGGAKGGMGFQTAPSTGSNRPVAWLYRTEGWLGSLVIHRPRGLSVGRPGCTFCTGGGADYYYANKDTSAPPNAKSANWS